MTQPHDGTSSAEQPTTSTQGTLLRVVLFVVLVATGYFAYRNWGHLFDLDVLATKEAELHSNRADHPYLVYGIAFAIYVLVTGMSLPGATILSLTFAWYFGFWPALVLVSFASTTGATLAFLLSRFLFRDAVQRKFGNRLEKFNAALARDGAFYLFTLRLMPSVPFFLINIVMGLTPIRTSTYWWVSQIGMLPGTIVYVFAGSQLPDLQTLSQRGVDGILSPTLVVAFIVLAVFPLVVKRLLGQTAARADAARESA